MTSCVHTTGDYIPNHGFYEIITSMFAYYGFMQITIFATWLLNVSQTVVSTRVMATMVARSLCLLLGLS